MNDFMAELRWREMLQDHTPGLEDALQKGSMTGYIGFDPTAPSLTIGNYVQIMLLRLFQLSGHRPIVLMGGATGRIGDPSGKDKERELKSTDELDQNLAIQLEQIQGYLDFEGPYAARIVNNLDFYANMDVLDFMRNVGKTLTVNYMMSKESVKKRIETGISFTEFSYQLLQAYDFQVLYQEYDCKLQMGGSDQWGNITSGTEFIRRNAGGKAYAVTTPLLTKNDGTKFGKSEQGNIWLSPEMTSPYRFYQFWINADDADIAKFTRYFTLKSEQEVLQMEIDLQDDPRERKRLLAEELTRRIHSDKAYEAVLQVSELLFNRKADKTMLQGLSREALGEVAREIPSFSVAAQQLKGGITIIDLVAEITQVVSSKSDARRAIQANALSVNKDKVSDPELRVSASDLLHDKYLLVENGKKNKFIVEVK